MNQKSVASKFNLLIVLFVIIYPLRESRTRRGAQQHEPRKDEENDPSQTVFICSIRRYHDR